MRVNPANSLAPKLPLFDQVCNVGVGSRSRRRQGSEVFQEPVSLLQVAARQFTDDKGMRHYETIRQQSGQVR